MNGGQLRFRLRALGLHLLASFAALTLVLGGLYLGWYRWPGWYLADAGQVTLVLIAVDLVAGPLLTSVIAAPTKARRELTRDVAVIVALQACALGYGMISLWHGRPLYYALSEGVIQVVQAYDIDPQELRLARERHAAIVPHWYSLPTWIWAPLPQDPTESNRIVASAVMGGADVISMPRYYQSWTAGLPTLRAQLTKVDDVKYFSGADRHVLAQRMRDAGIPTDEANAIAMTGRAWPLLAVFDTRTLELRRIFRSR